MHYMIIPNIILQKGLQNNASFTVLTYLLTILI